LQAFNEGRWYDAAQLYRRAQELSQTAGDRVSAAYSAMNLAEILGHHGRVQESSELFEEAILTFVGMKIGVGHAAATTLLADLCLRTGDLERADQLVREARDVCGAMDSQQDLEDVEVVEIDLLRAEGRHGAAVTAAEVLLGRRPDAGPLNRARAHRIAGSSLIALDQPVTAREHLDQALAIAESMQANFEIAHVLARIGDLDVPEAEAARVRADDLFASMGLRAKEPGTSPWIQPDGERVEAV
jgi:tetratricopeptide (TPR) repeat protein